MWRTFKTKSTIQVKDNFTQLNGSWCADLNWQRQQNSYIVWIPFIDVDIYIFFLKWRLENKVLQTQEVVTETDRVDKSQPNFRRFVVLACLFLQWNGKLLLLNWIPQYVFCWPNSLNLQISSFSSISVFWCFNTLNWKDNKKQHCADQSHYKFIRQNLNY